MMDGMLEGQAKIYNHAFRLIDSMALKCAIELGIPDAIDSHGGAMSLPALLSSLGLPASRSSHLHRLMRFLTRSALFAFDNQAYSLTPLSRLLLRSAPSLAPLVLCMLDPIYVQPYDAMSRWFRSGDDTCFSMAHGGRSFSWDRSVNEAMASDSSAVMGGFVKACSGTDGVLQGVGSIVDVGGGTGTAAIAIANAFPNLRCTVLDLPHVVETVKKNAALPDRLQFLAGDMFQHIPPADAILLKCVLHDWSNEDCVKILKQAKSAITANNNEKGKIIIIDVVLNMKVESNDTIIETQLLCDIMMMVQLGGQERDEDEWKRIFHEVGFSNYKIRPILGIRSIIEVFP